MKRKQANKNAFSRSFSLDARSGSGSVPYSRRREGVRMPDEWIGYLKKEGIPLILFLDQDSISKPDSERLDAVTRKFNGLRAKVIGKIKGSPSLFEQARSAIAYYDEFEKKASKELEKKGDKELEKKGKPFKPPIWDVQLKMSDIIVDVLYDELIEGALDAAFYAPENLPKRLANSLLICSYYACIARSLDLHADLYSIPDHAIVALASGRKRQFVDPSFRVHRVEKEKKVFNDRYGGGTIDYQNPKKIDYHGLASAWNNKAGILMATGKLRESLKAFDLAIRMDPEDAGAWNNKGLALFMLASVQEERKLLKTAGERCSEALVAFDRALELAPDDAGAWSNKGIALFMLASLEEEWDVLRGAIEQCNRALVAFDRALELAPDDADALANKGLVLSMLASIGKKQRRFEDAIEQCNRALVAFDHALELAPDDADAWNNKGLALSMLASLEEKMNRSDAANKTSEKAREALEQASKLSK